MFATPNPGPLNPVTQRASAAISAEDGKISFTSICTPNGMMEQLGEWLCQF